MTTEESIVDDAADEDDSGEALFMENFRRLSEQPEEETVTVPVIGGKPVEVPVAEATPPEPKAAPAAAEATPSLAELVRTGRLDDLSPEDRAFVEDQRLVGRREAEQEGIRRGAYLELAEAQQSGEFAEKIKELAASHNNTEREVADFFYDYRENNPNVTPDNPNATGNEAREIRERSYKNAVEEMTKTQAEAVAGVAKEIGLSPEFVQEVSGLPLRDALGRFTSAAVSAREEKIREEERESLKYSKMGERLEEATVPQSSAGLGIDGEFDDEALFMENYEKMKGR